MCHLGAGASGSAHQQGSTSQAARDGETRGADVSEAEFASEAQKAQEQTQAGRQAATELDMFAEVLEEPPDGAAAAAAGARLRPLFCYMASSRD